MQYKKFMYLWPPRPQTTIKPFSSHFEAMKKRANWIGQLKMNGQRNGLYVDPDGGIDMWNRHNTHHLNYNAQAWVIDMLKKIIAESKAIPGQWLVLDGELLHCKDKTTKNIFYFWDVLVYNGEYLIGTTYEERHKILLDLFSAITPVSEDEGVIKVTDNFWLAKNIEPEQYDEVWKRTETSFVEGFVFKNKIGRLKPCIGMKNNPDWMVRCRKEHAGGCYKF
jgi:ATP-dependent DNA ligase